MKRITGWIIHKPIKERLSQDKYENERFVEEAQKANIDLQFHEPEAFDIIVTNEGENSIFLEGSPVELPDFVLPRLGAHTSYFSLAVLRHLERLGVHIVNHPNSIEMVKDKLYTQQILAQNNLPVPQTMLVKFPISSRLEELVEENLGFPVVVKTVYGSQGSGVYLSKDRSSFRDLMQLINSTNTNMNIILQKFVKDSFGRDLRVFVIGGRAVACMMRSSDSNFKANYSQGGRVESFELTPEIEWIATESAKLLGLDISGIDLLFDGEHYKICEANSAPGFEGMEKASGINIAAEIFSYIRIRLNLL